MAEPGLGALFGRFRLYLELVRFSHTVFALPFALASLLWAAEGLPSLRTFALVLLCMVTCRNSAMAFNRLVDLRFDAANPRTAFRHLPRGLLGKKEVVFFIALNASLFVLGAFLLNPLAGFLSFPALGVVFGYSLCKRFTSASHLVLGLALSISPMGAWIAVRGAFGLEPLGLSAILLFWVAGFDAIYALQDLDFDKGAGLHSLPARFGARGALRLAALFHFVMVALLVLLAFLSPFPPELLAAALLCFLLLLHVHFFRRDASLERAGDDFFRANALVSLVIFVAVSVGVWRVFGR